MILITCNNIQYLSTLNQITDPNYIIDNLNTNFYYYLLLHKNKSPVFVTEFIILLTSLLVSGILRPGFIMEIVPLSKVPQYSPILAHWAFMQWYVNRNTNFSTVMADYHRRADFTSLPVSFAAIVNGAPVGMASFKEFDLQSHRHFSPWLSALYVIPEFRKKGIGEKLIYALTDFAWEQHFQQIYLFTDHRDTNHLTVYYEKRGWSTIENTIDNDGLSTTIMKIKLPGMIQQK